MKTVSAKPAEMEERWYLIDAREQIVGRVAAKAAALLRGKHLADFSPHANMKTHVVVINAEQARFTGKKLNDKTYYWHSGWPGGLKAATAGELLEKKPEEILRRAINGMVPKNRLGRNMMTRVRIIRGAEHTHQAQKPVAVDMTARS